MMSFWTFERSLQRFLSIWHPCLSDNSCFSVLWALMDWTKLFSSRSERISRIPRTKLVDSFASFVFNSANVLSSSACPSTIVPKVQLAVHARPNYYTARTSVVDLSTNAVVIEVRADWHLFVLSWKSLRSAILPWIVTLFMKITIR